MGILQQVQQGISSRGIEMIIGKGKQIKIGRNFIGTLENGNLLCDRCVKGKFQLYDGWGMSKELIEDLAGIWTKIFFRVWDSQNEPKKLLYTLEVSASDWLKKGIDYNNKFLKEQQLILPENMWNRKIMASVRMIE